MNNALRHTSLLHREQQQGLYLRILPMELIYIINDYYYGPLEIAVLSYGSGIGDISLKRYISTESGTTLEISMSVILPIQELVAIIYITPMIVLL